MWNPAGPSSFWASEPEFPGGHGGLVSTADDYLSFVRMMMNSGKGPSGRQVLSEASIHAMMSDKVPVAVKARSPFSPGFGIIVVGAMAGRQCKSPYEGSRAAASVGKAVTGFAPIGTPRRSFSASFCRNVSSTRRSTLRSIADFGMGLIWLQAKIGHGGPDDGDH